MHKALLTHVYCPQQQKMQYRRSLLGSTALWSLFSIMRCSSSMYTVCQVAIKKIPGAFDDLIDAKRIVREIRLLRHFNHENVIKITDILPPPSLTDFEDVYVITELMETVSLCPAMCTACLVGFVGTCKLMLHVCDRCLPCLCLTQRPTHQFLRHFFMCQWLSLAAYPRPPLTA